MKSKFSICLMLVYLFSSFASADAVDDFLAISIKNSHDKNLAVKSEPKKMSSQSIWWKGVFELEVYDPDPEFLTIRGALESQYKDYFLELDPVDKHKKYIIEERTVSSQVLHNADTYKYKFTGVTVKSNWEELKKIGKYRYLIQPAQKLTVNDPVASILNSDLDEDWKKLAGQCENISESYGCDYVTHLEFRILRVTKEKKEIIDEFIVADAYGC